MLVAALAATAGAAAEWNTIAGDINMDGQVNLADHSVMRNEFGLASLPCGQHESWTLGDLNDDGEVGPEDFYLLRDNFGATGGPVSVPSPAPVINHDMVLTVDRITGAATLKNVNPTANCLAEGSLSGSARFKANDATVWSIGNPVFPGAATEADLTFCWTEVGQPSGQVYAGQVVITPEPATLALLGVGALAAARKRRQ
ncbi:MAG: PEP-CTERM sorting domain-containing protein [Planctomycetota bacterium]|nr:PEP-CTERM sorting domain-containing protein [Planctomycetota bacterium]